MEGHYISNRVTLSHQNHNPNESRTTTTTGK